jgi:type IV pilus assembly protein PilA
MNQRGQRAASGRGARGFTLIELMIVVAIVGILAVLAVYGVRKYIYNSKSAEAQNSIGQIAKDAVAAYEREGSQATTLAQKTSAAVSRHLCGTVSATVPASAASIAGKKYQSAAAEWNADGAGNSGFSCLKFSIDMPQYYMYSYGVSGAGSAPGNSFTAQAQGDLNGDGTLSMYSLTGSITANYTVNTSPNMLVVRGEE